MSDINKVNIDKDSVTKLLQSIFSSEISGLQGIAEGKIAQTLSFETNNSNYIIQFNNNNMSQGNNFEIAFHDLLQLNNIPMRNVVAKGDFGEISYLITEKINGVSLSSLSAKEYLEVLPNVIEILLNCLNVNIDCYSGFGWLNDKMNGLSSSWEDHLNFIDEEVPGQFYGKWHTLFKNTFLEKDLFYHFFQLMKRDYKKIPSIRKLVHGGYGYGNVLIKNKRVLAVIDWQDARYGDPLFDLTYLIFWQNNEITKATIDLYIKQSQNLGIELVNFEERIRCYKYYIGIDGMRFSAKTNDKNLYDFIVDKLSTMQ